MKRLLILVFLFLSLRLDAITYTPSRYFGINSIYITGVIKTKTYNDSQCNVNVININLILKWLMKNIC
jgi:hypothetical protein